MRRHALLRCLVIAFILCVTSATVFANGETFLLFSTGRNSYGQLGLGNHMPRSYFERAAGVRDAVGISGGYAFSLALGSSGTVWSTGCNTTGQLGLHNLTPVNVFTATDNPPDATAIATGDHHSLARSATDGTVWASGGGEDGQLGLGYIGSANAFVETPGTGFTAVSGGHLHSLALGADGRVWSTGRNAEGELGLGDKTSRSGFTQTPSPDNVVAISAGRFHSLLLTSDGRVWGAGSNNFGQLGLAGVQDTDTFTQIPDLSNVMEISAGGDHSMVRLSDGTLMATGYNAQGELGVGDNANRAAWTAVPGVSDVIAISVGYVHALILTSDRTIWATGCNEDGELGLGDTTDRNVFTQVPGLFNVAAIAACDYHSLALTAKNLTVTAPSAADVTVQRGGTYAVTWTSSSLPPNAKVIITLRNSAGESWVLANGVPNKGLWTWRVGTWKSKTQAVYGDGDDYRIEVGSLDGTAWDDSDNEFAIGVPQALLIAGPTNPDESSTTFYTCTAQFNFGADQDVTDLVKWRSLSPNPKDPARYQSCKFAVMQPGGKLLTKSVAADQAIRITAALGKGKAALTGFLDVTINDVP